MKKGNLLSYKGYYTRIKYDTETHIIYGKVEGINDLIYFESDSAKEIEKEFHSAVDDYLSFCKENNLKPDKPYKGTFNVRIDTELHRKLSLEALKNNESLNSLVEKSIRFYLDNKTEFIYEQLIESLSKTNLDYSLNNEPSKILSKWKTIKDENIFSPGTYTEGCLEN